MAARSQINKAIYPGTFDPVTNGHLSLIERACHLFDELLVAVAINAGKSPFFEFEERIRLLEESLKEEPYQKQVKVLGFDGLLADFAVETKANAIIRGLRAVSDFEYEFQMALMNRKLARNVETVFLMPSLSWVYLSSTIVKDVARHGGDVAGLVPPPVKKAFDKKLSFIKSK
ncbi:MAG: pantetheine-phosphate adenylyltransferase [Candidatus Zixiibacteriota bacterium]